MSGKEIIILLLTFTFEVEMVINPNFYPTGKCQNFVIFFQLGQAVKKVLSNTNGQLSGSLILTCLMKRNQQKILLQIKTLLSQMVLTLKCVPLNHDPRALCSHASPCRAPSAEHPQPLRWYHHWGDCGAAPNLVQRKGWAQDVAHYHCRGRVVPKSMSTQHDKVQSF